MSNEFDKEVADKIAAKNVDKNDDGIKWAAPEGGIIKRNSVIFEEGDFVALDINNNVIAHKRQRESKEMSKIDFYRQKVQQYEAVENLIQSIECEIDDAGVARDELCSDYCSKDDVLYHSYMDMIDAYKKCYAILEEVLKDI